MNPIPEQSIPLGAQRPLLPDGNARFVEENLTGLVEENLADSSRRSGRRRSRTESVEEVLAGSRRQSDSLKRGLPSLPRSGRFGGLRI